MEIKDLVNLSPQSAGQNRYSRHELLTALGSDGQKRIRQAKALVIGAGGLGSPAILYLASAGLSEIIVVDDDSVDLTNLQRQIIHKMDRIGMKKAESAKISANELNPDVRVRAVTKRPTPQELSELISQVDVVLDCTDNTASRYEVNAACRKLKKPLVTAGCVSFVGQITVCDFRNPESACYACVFPNHEGEDEKASKKGVFAPLVGTLGSMQAGEALKVVGGFGTPLTGRLLMIDLLSQNISILSYRRDENCPCCGKQRSGK